MKLSLFGDLKDDIMQGNSLFLGGKGSIDVKIIE